MLCSNRRLVNSDHADLAPCRIPDMAARGKAMKEQCFRKMGFNPSICGLAAIEFTQSTDDGCRAVGVVPTTEPT
jgi:hypothetical protein